MREFVDAKYARDAVNNERVGGGYIDEDEETQKRKGKKVMPPGHLLRYY